MVQLGGLLENKIVDLDPAIGKGAVLVALCGAIGRDDEPELKADRAAVIITGLWATKTGQQIARAKMSSKALEKIDK